MKSSDKSNLIIEEANGIIENFIRKKSFGNKNTGKICERAKIFLLSVLTISAVIILGLVIKFK